MPRLHWMDSVRGLAVLMVIAYHATTVPSQLGIPIPRQINDVFVWLAPVRMPLLMFVSGMLLSRSLAKPLGHYVGGKLRNIAWPYVVWSLITAWLLQAPESINDPIRWVAGPFHMWFLVALLFLYGIALITKHVPPLIVAGILATALALSGIEFLPAQRVLYFGIFFFVGAAFDRHRERIDRLGAWWPAGLIAVLCLHLAVGGTLYDGSREVGNVVGTVALVLAVTWFAAKLPRIAFLEWLGSNSIVFYVSHFAAQYLVAQAAVALGIEAPVIYLVVAAGGFLVPALLTALRPHTNLLFGLPKPKAKATPAPQDAERASTRAEELALRS